MPTESAFRFGPFSLLPAQRTLLEDGRPVRLGSRAFDLLVALVERAGNVVPTADLVTRVWPTTIVEGGALRVHMAGLRKVLGDGREGHRYVVNVPQKGYCFVAPVARSTAPLAEEGSAAVPLASSSPEAVVPAAHLPAQVSRLIGRADEVADILRELPQRRCITLVGAAGMGKTTLALAAARAAAEQFNGQAVFVGLAPLADPELVTGALISALGLTSPPSDAMRGLLAYLRERRVLIVLDNCEHVIDAAARLSEQLLYGAPGVHLLVTSREPLRIQGEWVQRLASLSVPPPTTVMTAAQALQISSVELFVERARACMDTFEFSDADVPSVAAICRALDGIPLALELAASGVERTNVRGIAAQLGDRLALLTQGRRTALPRHQTLRAALDWGYALLSRSQRALLRRLSIFRGHFTRDGAQAVCNATGTGAVDNDLFDLASKSFLMSDISGDTVHYWLLETTLEYAKALREEAGETDELARRHAQHMLEMAGAGEATRTAMPPAAWLASQAYLIDDYRAALDWSLGPRGDGPLGIALAGSSASLWFACSLIPEYLGIAERAMLSMGRIDVLDPRQEITMCEAHGAALWHMQGTGPKAEASFRRALGVAERVGSRDDITRSLWGLWMIASYGGDYAQAASIAQRYSALMQGSDDPTARVLHHRLMSLSLHHVGQHVQALRHTEEMIALQSSGKAFASNVGFHMDQPLAGMVRMARFLWMLGLPDQAFVYAQQAVARGLAIDHSLSLCFALSMACTPVAIWSGRWEIAGRYTDLLLERTRRHSLEYWHAFGEGFNLVLRRRDGATDALSALAQPVSWMTLKDVLCTCDGGLADAAMLDRGANGTAGWCAPELMRQRGERALAAGDTSGAAEWLRRGLELARQHEALSWELRCATSLAGLLEASGATAQARETLAPVLHRFSEGHDTADLRRASALLGRLDGPLS